MQQLATVGQLCGASMVCTQQQSVGGIVTQSQTVVPTSTVTTVQQSYPVTAVGFQGPPVYVNQFTTDPAAAPYGTRGETANAYLNYMKSPKVSVTTTTVAPPPVVVLPPPVDLTTGEGANGEAPVHLTGTVTGVENM
uniref:Uncharacterized protein n=1 Tax=Hemiselmis andersenii TaxID=464988 RepID=A0A6T8P5T6_HEMAN